MLAEQLTRRTGTLALSKQLLPPLENELDQTRDLLRALAGNLPNEDVGATFEISTLKLPEDLPVSLPSKLVDQRPDVRAPEAQLHAANAQVGVAIANAPASPRGCTANTGAGIRSFCRGV
jgi:outer membrane protein TolC